MRIAYTVLLFVHLFAIVVWVGGMFVMHFAVRPTAVELLQPPHRLPLLAGVLRRFFYWVVLAVIAVLATGFAMIVLAGGFASAHPSVHAMLVLGVIMSIIFVIIRVGAYRRLQDAVAEPDWPQAAGELGRVRTLVATNLILGIITIAVATIGRALL